MSKMINTTQYASKYYHNLKLTGKKIFFLPYCSKRQQTGYVAKYLLLFLLGKRNLDQINCNNQLSICFTAAGNAVTEVTQLSGGSSSSSRRSLIGVLNSADFLKGAFGFRIDVTPYRPKKRKNQTNIKVKKKNYYDI